MMRRVMRAARAATQAPWPQARASRRGAPQVMPRDGLEALEFLERSRDMAAEPVTAAPRPHQP
jgi:uncharacterized membrane protein